MEGKVIDIRHLLSDDIEYTEEDESFTITRNEAQQLWNYLSKEFINPEFYPHVHVMIKRLIDYLDN